MTEFSPHRLRAGLEAILREAGVVATGECVALSGGLDSTVLAAALASTRGRPLRAVHVDHALHPDSARWSAHSVAQAGRLGIACEVVRVDARPAPGESPEAAARSARYAALAGRLAPGEVLLTAHHGDDQLETILLQWLRGGGLRAVAGMRAVAPFAAGWVARPLLDFSREELRSWAGRQDLAWLEDPSNTERRFDRNYLRLEVLPALRARWPAAARTVARVACQAAEALDLEAEVAASDLAGLCEGATLVLERLATLPAARQRVALRAWLRRRGIDPPPAATIEALRHDMLRAAPQRLPETRWPGAVVRRYRGRLHAASQSAGGHGWQAGQLLPASPFNLGALGRLELRAANGTGLSRLRLPDRLQVRPGPSVARFRPAGSAYRRDLRKWLQERGVLPWQRAALPFICAGEEILAVGDLAVGADFAAAPGEPSWCIVWEGRPVLTDAEARAATDHV